MKKLSLLLFALLLMIASPALAVQKMDIDDLKAELSNNDVVILDVRTGSDWGESKFKIKGAVRASSKDFGTWSQQYPKDKKLVLYCA